MKRCLFLITILILLTISAIIPESRKVMLMQARYLASGHTYPGYSLVNLDGNGTLADLAKNSGINLSTEWQTWIARAVLDYTKGEEYCTRAIQAAPGQSHAYAAYLSVVGQEGSYYDRPEISSDHERRVMNPRSGRAMLQLARKGSELSPDNAFFNLAEAYAYFGLLEDGDAIQTLSAAARKNNYVPYYREACLHSVEYMRVADYPEVESYLPTVGRYLPYLRFVKLDSRLSSWHAERLLRQGKSAEAREILADILDVGSLIRKHSYSTSEYFGAVSAQWTVARTVPREGSQLADFDHPREQRLRIQQIGDTFQTRGWNDVAAMWREESENMQHEWDSWNDYAEIDLFAYIPGIFAATQLDSMAITFALLLLAISLLLAMVLNRARAAPSQPARLRAKLALIILTLGPWVVFTGGLAFSHFMTFG